LVSSSKRHPLNLEAERRCHQPTYPPQDSNPRRILPPGSIWIGQVRPQGGRTAACRLRREGSTSTTGLVWVAIHHDEAIPDERWAEQGRREIGSGSRNISALASRVYGCSAGRTRTTSGTLLRVAGGCPERGPASNRTRESIAWQANLLYLSAGDPGSNLQVEPEGSCGAEGPSP